MIQSPILGYISERNGITISKRYLHSHVHCSIIHNSQDMETTQKSINRWMDKENVVYIHIHIKEYYSAIRRKEILPFLATWMDLECIMLCDISQKEKEQILYKSLKAELIETESRMMVARGWREGGMGRHCLMGMEFQLGKMKKFWQWMVVMGAQ